MSTQIKFGTDGWRAIIAKDFTFDAVARVAQAAADVMKEKLPGKNRMIVGYDRRFLSREFAQTAASIYAQAGYQVLFSKEFAPTPAIAWHAKNQEGAVGATMITASHNPPQWNGFKFKEIFGGSASPETTALFEKRAEELLKNPPETPDAASFDGWVEKGKITYFDPSEGYFDAILSRVDTKRLRDSAPRVAIDVMFGAASGHYKNLLSRIGLQSTILHDDENPGFNGTPPEPIGKNLPELCKLVEKEGYSCGLATDGDADRLGAVDETGQPFTTQQILSVIYWHMLTHKGKEWSIARSASTTRMVDLLAQRAGQKCHETPVGFKHIAAKMVADEAQIGGEESGGVGFIDHIPDRDGLLTGLLLLEIMAVTGKGLKAVYEDICREVRPYYFRRLDLHLTDAQKANALGRLESAPPKEWLGREVDELLTLDGYKFYLKDGGWVLIRASGTEPIFRLYSEAESQDAADQLVEATQKFVTGS